jgi:hypothetical protein
VKKWLIAVIATVIIIGLSLVDGGSVYVKQLINRPPKAAFSYRTPTRTLKYIAPTDRDMIMFLNNSTDPDGDPLISKWYVRFNGTGDWRLLNSSRDHWGRLPVSNGKGHEIKLIVSDGMKEDSISVFLPVDPTQLAQYPERKFGIRVKGILYEAGTKEWKQVPIPSEDQMLEELYVIRNELGCNGIRIFGDHDETILKCAEIAMHYNFNAIMLSPRYLDLSMKDHIAKFSAFALKATLLSRKSSNIILCVGNELTLDTIEWIDMPSVDERSKYGIDHPEERRKDPQKLNQFLMGLVDSIPREFNGQLTYARGAWEDVRWDMKFHIVSSNQYWGAQESNESYIGRILGLKRYGKPVQITEFGAATYEGAMGMAGSGWAQAEGKSYSQLAQARYLAIYADAISRAQVDGCYLLRFKDRFNDRKASASIIEDNRRKLSFYAYQSFVVAA